MPTEADIVTTYYHAPQPLQSKWNQLAYVKTYRSWYNDRRQDLKIVIDQAEIDSNPFVFIDIDSKATSVGPNGHFSDFILDYSIDPEFLVDDFDTNRDAEALVTQYAEDYIERMKSVVVESCPDNLSFKEYGVWVASKHYTESQVADAFGVSVGTVRGKMGRVREKIEAANQLIRHNDELEYYADLDQSDFGITPQIAAEIEENELPISVIYGDGSLPDQYTSHSF